MPKTYHTIIITPGQRVPVLRDEARMKIEWLSWGFPPAAPKRPPIINARGETVHQLPTFRQLFQVNRCVVWADGFYEWRRDPTQPRPQPFFFNSSTNPPSPWLACGSRVIRTRA
jgi:putative SOS response-associated peptidase YedK